MSATETIRAFPSAAIDDDFGGMALRDWFAGQALVGDMAAQSETLGVWPNEPEAVHIEGRAALYYRFADAMMAERAKGGAA